jgi:hypothetical protein
MNIFRFSNPAGSIEWLETNCTEDFHIGKASKEQWIGTFKVRRALIVSQLAGIFMIVCCLLQTFMAACPDTFFEMAEPLSLLEDGKVTGVYLFGGTHTGTPYAPKLPNQPELPPIEAAGTAIKNDPQRATFTFEKGKVVFLHIENPEGTVNHGGPGWYKQMGGEIPVAPAPDGTPAPAPDAAPAPA